MFCFVQFLTFRQCSTGNHRSKNAKSIFIKQSTESTTKAYYDFTRWIKNSNYRQKRLYSSHSTMNVDLSAMLKITISKITRTKRNRLLIKSKLFAKNYEYDPWKYLHKDMLYFFKANTMLHSLTYLYSNKFIFIIKSESILFCVYQKNI